MKILFVCTGNTCRSPMAEALMKQKSLKFDVQSAGVYAANNEPANRNATEALKGVGITCDHSSQPVTNKLIDWADLVLTMTEQHKQLLMLQYQGDQKKYFTLKEYVLGAETSTMNHDISDPFGGELCVYKETLKELDNFLELFIQKHN